MPPTPADIFKNRAPRLAPARALEDATAGLDLPAGASARTRYETAVLRSGLHPLARLLALVLATYTIPETGVIPEDDQPGQRRLANACRLPAGTTRYTLAALERLGWITRQPAPGTDQAWFQPVIPSTAPTAP